MKCVKCNRHGVKAFCPHCGEVGPNGGTGSLQTLVMHLTHHCDICKRRLDKIRERLDEVDIADRPRFERSLMKHEDSYNKWQGWLDEVNRLAGLDKPSA